MTSIDIIGLGALNTDHLYRVERILGDGEALVTETKSSPGGSAANTIYGLAKLGVKGGITGVVGGDIEGEELIRDFQSVGLDTSQIKVKPGAKTGSVLCLSDQTGRRSLYVVPGANSLLTINDLDLSYVNQAKMLHISSFADDSQFELLLGLMGKLNPSVRVNFAPGALFAARGLEALTPILKRSHVLFINRDELRQLTGEDIVSGAEICLRQGCRVVAVTLGKGVKLELGRGASRREVAACGYIRDADNEYAIEAVAPNTMPEVDTTGAGDAFAAGFTYGLLGGKGLQECGRLGNVIARFSTGGMGARQGLPTLDELAQRCQELYNKPL